MFGLVVEEAASGTEVTRSQAPIASHNREVRKLVMISQDVRDVTRNLEKIWSSAESLRKQNVDLKSGLRDNETLATRETARINELEHELASEK